MIPNLTWTYALRVTPKPLCLRHRFRQTQVQSTNHTQFTANTSQPKGEESNLQVAGVSGGYSRHSSMSLGRGRATICGGGSCNNNPDKQKPTIRYRAATSPNQSSAHQSTPTSRESKRSAHLAERVVLLLEPLEAALLRHGKTLPPPTRRPYLPPKP